MDMKTKKTGQQGFTLMEIMVVVAILALIIGAVAVNIGGANKQAKISVTKTALSSLDSALERFKLDFNAYPTVVGDGKNSDEGGAGNWTKVSKALSASGLSDGKMFNDVLEEVLQGINVDTTDKVAVEQMFTGPYIKAKGGIVLDGFKKPFVLFTDNTQGLYQLYSVGENGKDDEGKGDDIVSEGSQLDR